MTSTIYVVSLVDKQCNQHIERAFVNYREAQEYAEEKERLFEYETDIHEIELYQIGDYFKEMYL